MKLSISKVRSALPEEWDMIWKECEYSTYYQSREWAEIWHTYSPGKSRLIIMPKIIFFSDGKQALLPLSAYVKYKGLVKKYLSSCDGYFKSVTFGGWIAKDKLEVEHAILLRRYLTNKIRFSLANSVVWRMNPFDDLSLKASSSFSREDTTIAVDLTAGFDAVYKNSSKSHRYNYRKAKKHGIIVKIASTLDEWQQYYQVYQSSIARWGDQCLGKIKWETFHHMFQLNSPNIKLWVACYEGRVIAGGLRFYSSKIVVGWQATSHQDYLHLSPHTLLHYEVIRDSCDKGYCWYDFGPSAGIEGVYNFKKGFRGKELPCPLILVNNNLKFKILFRDLFRLVKINVGGSGLSVCD